MSRAGLLLAVPLAGALAGCVPRHVAGPVPAPHYVLGQPYQTGGVWRYPREQFAGSETGLATVASRASGLTADGELFDQHVLAAAHRTLQLPALARVVDLQTGRAVLVRINDRGPAEPGRLIAVTRRTADLLGETGNGPFPVRIELQETESRQLAGTLAPAAPLQVEAAPQGAVQAETLAPPDGAALSARGRVVSASPVVTAAPPTAAPPTAAPDAVPLRLPEQVWQLAPSPGSLYVVCGSFARPQYAAILQRRLADLGARVSAGDGAARDAAWQVRIGPLRDAAEADATLDRALRAGVSDARIIVDARPD